MTAPDVESRAARHAALGDATRLAIIDELAVSDRSPLELRRHLGIESNLLAHHLDVLELVGLVRRTRSSGDGRRRYAHLVNDSLDGLRPGRHVRPTTALFVCTRNSARSQLAAALWTSLAGVPAESAGTDPAERIHPGAVAAARRAGLDIAAARPRHIGQVGKLPRLVVTVCDQAHEALPANDAWLHWSVVDPITDGSRAAFELTITDLRARITTLLGGAA